MPYFRTKQGRRDIVQCVGIVIEDAHIEPVVILSERTFDEIHNTLLCAPWPKLVDAFGEEEARTLLQLMRQVSR